MKFNPLVYPILFTHPDRLIEPGPWVEHIPFALAIVDMVRPGTLVELGTHTGNSYCAFCQAVKELKIETRCYAVDTWKGDPQAGYYGEEIFSNLRDYHNPKYSSFSQLIRSTFDKAVQEFEDGSIDLLHIDGLHTYEAVKHDFETWLPKMSQKGIVLFHDICEKENDFGVWKLWDELKVDYPTFEFSHGHGLGVLAVSTKYPPALNLILNSTLDAPVIRDFFHQLGYYLRKEMSIRSLIAHIAEREQAIQTLTTKTIEQDQENQSMKNQLINSQAEVLFYALSKSWRITRPLRKMNKLIRGRKSVSIN